MGLERGGVGAGEDCGGGVWSKVVRGWRVRGRWGGRD